ncbi:hypothetical protein CPC08DRAFT_650511, partial [Agrocybe pediades]
MGTSEHTQHSKADKLSDHEIPSSIEGGALDSEGESEAPVERNDQRLEDPAEEILAEDPPLLMDLITLGDPTMDIHKSIVNRYSEDPKFAVILENPSSFKNFEVSNGLIFLKDNRKRTLCIPDVMINGRRVREMIISHAHSILAHLGPSKTIIYLRDNVWWK